MKTSLFFSSLLAFSFFSPFGTFAYEVRTVGTEIRNDFVLSPAKVEVKLDPGKTARQTLTVTNRHDRSMEFSIGIEDFIGSENPGKAVVLLGGERGPYSLRDFLKPEISSFTLKPKEEITFSVDVSVPEDATPGGRYGSVLVSSAPSRAGGSGAATISRLGALFFVRVNGDADESGALSEFRLRGNKKFFTHGPFPFEIFYKNSGNVHLIPYGKIEIKNIFNQSIGGLEVDPYFALPASTRYREILWDKSILFGRYTASIALNRGYDNIVDRQSFVFWVFPWKTLLGLFAGIFVVVSFALWVGKKFEIRKKR